LSNVTPNLYIIHETELGIYQSLKKEHNVEIICTRHNMRISMLPTILISNVLD